MGRTVRVRAGDEDAIVPKEAFELMLEILAQMANGNAVIVRTDGCVLRGSPDTVINQGGTGVDYLTDCPTQTFIYLALLRLRLSLLAPLQG